MKGESRTRESPRAPKKPKKVRIHGDELVDEYHWLRHRSDPDTLKYIQAENEYRDAVMDQTAGLQERLYEELLERAIDDEPEVPTKMDDYYYYTKTEQGKQYSILCRRKGSLEAPEEIVLDQNELAEGREFFHVESVKQSPDHKLAAYSFDTEGAEYYSIRFVDIAARKPLPDLIPDTGGFEWGATSRVVYYIVHEEAHRPFRVLRHVLGTEREDDEVVFEEPDQGCEYMSLTKSKSKEFLFVTSQTLTTGEVSYLRSDDETGNFRSVMGKKKGVRYYVLHRGSQFFIVTNDGAPNFRILRTPIPPSSPGEWEELLPHREFTIIDISDPHPWVDVFTDYLAVFERTDAISSIRIIGLEKGDSHLIEMPEALRSVTPMENPDIGSRTLRFAYASMVTPRRIYEYDMTSRSLTLVKQDEMPDYDPCDYHSERIQVTASDGEKIPVNIVHRKDVNRNAPNPLLLYAYGAAGDFETISPTFDIGVLSLLERGFIYAVAGIRGGGEYGQPWYDKGRMMSKKRAFLDFIECAEHLIETGYTSADRLAISGASAGGLLVAAVTTMKPNLFRTVVAEVPFVDVVHTMMDRSIPLVIGEYEEYGDIRKPDVYAYCKSYSPYENISRTKYPDMLVTSAMNDPRVPFWEPIKWVAKLRDNVVGDSLIVLSTKMVEGHAGSSARYDALRDKAFKLAFIVHSLERTRDVV